MWRILVVGCALVQAPAPTVERAPRFGTFLEQRDDVPSTGFVTFDGEGRWWVVPALSRGPAPRADESGGPVSPEILRGGERGVAFDAEGRFYVARASPDGIVAYPRGDLWPSNLAFDSDRHEGVPFGRSGTELDAFREPRGVCLEHRGAAGGAPGAGERRLVVADAWNHRVVLLALATERSALAWARPVRAFGTHGAADGQLNHPNDVAVDARGHVWVADVGNDRVVEFDADGSFVRNVGGRGVEPGLFLSPTGLDVHGERVYVADRDNHRIQVFDLQGAFLYEFGEPALRPREGRGKLHGPTDVAISPDGTRAVVVEEIEDRVQVFGLVAGDAPGTIPVRDASAHYGGHCSARGELFAVAEPALGSVSVFDVSSGTPIEITKFGRPGTGPGRLSRPSAVLFDARAEVLYVADPFAYRVQAFAIVRAPDEPLRFDPNRARLVASLDLRACAALAAEWSTEPVDLAAGPAGEVHVLDAANRRVVVLDAHLAPLRTVALTDHDARRDGALRGLDWDPTAGTWILASGSSVSTALRGGLDVVDVARTTRGEAWYVDRGRHAISRRQDASGGGPFGWDPVAGRREPPPAGASVVRLGGPTGASVIRAGLGRGEFAHPESLAVDGHGRVYVVDAGNHRVQVLDEDGAYLDMFGARLFTEAARTPPVERPARAWDGAASVRTNDGAYRVRWKLRGGAPGVPARFERGASATLDAWVFSVGRPDAPVAVEALAVDGWMPDHQHGLAARPRVTRRDDGGFAVEGLRLFMSGAWELDFDVTADGVTRRAQVRVELE